MRGKEPKVNNQALDRVRQQHRSDPTHLCHQANLLCLILHFTTRQDDEMAPGQKMYPRATVKKIVKAHSDCKVSKNADVTVSWAPRASRRVLFEPARADLVMWRHRCSSIISSSCRRAHLHVPLSLYPNSMTETTDRLVKEAGIESKQAGERGITARSVKKVTGVRGAILSPGDSSEDR